MGIGTSKGAFYRDEGHFQASQWDNRYDDNIVSPQELQDRKDYLPSTTEVKDQMPFPDNKNPNTDFNNRFGNLPPSGILNDLKKPTGETVPLVRRIGWQDNSEEFQNLPDDKYIQRIDKSPGFFLRDEMQVMPLKKYSDRAKSLTKQTYDLYKSGDEDTVAAVQDWENRQFALGKADNEAGRKLYREAIEAYGSKTTMTKSAIWETYMKHLQDLAGADLEAEEHSPEVRESLEQLQMFDRIGRPQIDFKRHWELGKFK